MDIKIVGCSKFYDKKEVLYIDELNLQGGKVYGLIGKNGSGKSTLLQCIARLEEFSSGDIFYDGRCYTNSIKKDISVMMQKPYLFKCSVLDNITMGLKIRKLSNDVIDERLNYYLQYLCIDDLLYKNSRELSGGEQAKVALLRTAILETQITLLDEPTASMDIESTLKSENLIKAMATEDRSVVLVTHDYLQAERIADYIVFLDKGKVIEHGPKNIIFNNPKHKLLKQFLLRKEGLSR